MTSEGIDRNGSTENIIVLTENPSVGTKPSASEDFDRNGSTENLIVTNPSVSEDFDRNGSTENLIVSTSRIGDDEIVTVPEPANMAELQKL